MSAPDAAAGRPAVLASPHPAAARTRAFSLRARLLGWLFFALLAVWGLAVVFTYIEAHEEMDELGDLRLLQAAQVYALADVGLLERESAQRATPATAGHDFEHSHDDEGFGRPLFQRFDRTGRLLIADAYAPQAPFDPRPGLATMTVAGSIFRSAAVWQNDFQMRVFEPYEARHLAATSVVRRMLIPLAGALPLLVFMVWWIVTRGLWPLAEIARGVEGRDAANLAPLAPAELPLEATPLVEAVNRLFIRLDHALDQERRFTADAAHELRTPLAGLKVHAQVALASRDDAERRKALNALVGGVDRAAHLFEQLLLLARADRGQRIPRATLDLGEAARRAAANCAALAADKRIDLSVDAAAAARIEGAPALVGALLRNLVDNAVRYTPEGGRVEIMVERCDSGVGLTVRDNGPGIPRGQRERALQRFTRLAGQEVPGSGLGLSIVARIAELHAATLALDTGIDGRGLTVRMVFPAPLQKNSGGA